MKIEDMHLQEGEIEKLLKYLKLRDDWVSKSTIRDPDKKYRTMTLRIRALLEHDSRYNAQKDQLDAEAREYQLSSSFGRDENEIFRNSRIHFLGCTKCYDRYRTQVEKLAGDFVREIEEVTGREDEPRDSPENITYKTQLFIHDVLRILYHQEIFGMGIT
jgi:hypothetical protein